MSGRCTRSTKAPGRAEDFPSPVVITMRSSVKGLSPAIWQSIWTERPFRMTLHSSHRTFSRFHNRKMAPYNRPNTG